MKSFLLATALFLVGGLSACSSISVTNDYDNSVDFAALKTWSWLPEGSGGTNWQGVVSLTTSRVRESIESDLPARGYPKEAEHGSFLVSFHAFTQRVIEAGAAPYGYGWRAGYAVPEMSVYDEGTLVIDFIDPKTMTMIWRGTATSAVDNQASGEKRDTKIRDAVQQILDQFPPKKKS